MVEGVTIEGERFESSAAMWRTVLRLCRHDASAGFGAQVAHHHRVGKRCGGLGCVLVIEAHAHELIIGQGRLF